MVEDTITLHRCIPPGTSFRMLPYAHHLDARSFSFPNAFWPERWLVASGQLRLDDALLSLSLPPSATYASGSDAKFEFVHNELAFLAFSHGPMNCVGKALALQQLKTAVCALMQRLHIRPREGYTLGDYERNVKDYFVTVRGPLPVSLEVRGGKSE